MAIKTYRGIYFVYSFIRRVHNGIGGTAAEHWNRKLKEQISTTATKQERGDEK